MIWKSNSQVIENALQIIVNLFVKPRGQYNTTKFSLLKLLENVGRRIFLNKSHQHHIHTRNLTLLTTKEEERIQIIVNQQL